MVHFRILSGMSLLKLNLSTLPVPSPSTNIKPLASRWWKDKTELWVCIIVKLGVFMYRFSISDLPMVFEEYFTKSSEIHDYPTRHVNDLNLTYNKKSFSDHAILMSGPILWNSLPKTFKESKTIRHFQNHFLQKLIQNYDWFWFLSCTCLVWFQLVSVCFVWIFSFCNVVLSRAIYRPNWLSSLLLHLCFMSFDVIFSWK